MKKEIDIQIPRVPNFLLTRSQISISVAEFSDDELRKVGYEWTDKLIVRANQLRAGSKED